MKSSQIRSYKGTLRFFRPSLGATSRLHKTILERGGGRGRAEGEGPFRAQWGAIGPIGPYKGPMGPYKGPIGPKKSVLGPLDLFRCFWTFLLVSKMTKFAKSEFW